jgi:hypothetical protein
MERATLPACTVFANVLCGKFRHTCQLILVPGLVHRVLLDGLASHNPLQAGFGQVVEALAARIIWKRRRGISDQQQDLYKARRECAQQQLC